jgi:hypothetical protein
MSRPSHGWHTAKRHPDTEALIVDGCKIKARTNDGDDGRYLWLNIQVEGGWTYLVLDRQTRDVVLQTKARTKRECWDLADAAFRAGEVAA